MKLLGLGKLIVLLALLSPLGLAQPLEQTWVGAAKDSKAFVAIVAAQGRLLAYVCDGEKIAQWFRGAVGEGGAVAIELNSRTKLNARLTGDSASGTLELEGMRLEFTATKANGSAGLFRAELSANSATYTGGWIVNQRGEQRGAVIGGGGFAPSTSELLLGGGEAAGGTLCQGVRVTNGRIANIQGVGRVAVWQVTPACIGASR